MSKIYDIVIIGSGPAGLSAAVYASRAKLESLVIEKAMMSGGQVLNTYEVDNYLGMPGSNGFDMGMKFREHTESMGAKFLVENVKKIEEIDSNYRIVTEKEEIETKTVIIATGAKHRKLGVLGEENFSGKGVSYCATCDGAFFRNKITAVVGGGDVAVEDAIFLARMCQKVYVIHRRDNFRAAKSLTERLMELENVEIIWDTVVEEIKGEEMVSSILIENKKTGQKEEKKVDGVFIAVGIEPNSAEFKNFVEQDESGYIKSDETGKTDKAGIFAAGDVRTKMLRQIVTAVSDGANAVTSAEKYLLEAKK